VGKVQTGLPAGRDSKSKVNDSLELVAIGTVADQMPLIGFNRSLVKYGLRNLRVTKRKGLLALFETAGIKSEDIGTYEINYLIAPRLNAMGRMENAIESLRLLCIKNVGRAKELALTLDRTNHQRQKVVDEVVLHARKKIADEGWESIIIIAHESYHEGVIGLAASKLVEEFYRPAIVLSKGEVYSKASARSISGFNIIEAIRSLDSLIEGGGGHPMAAGFTIRTENIEIFRKKLEAISKAQLTKEILSKKLKIDLEIPFFVIDKITLQKLLLFEPTGLGNYTPTFLTKDVSVAGVRYVGRDLKHLKLTLVKDDMRFDAIGFNFGGLIKDLSVKDKLDIVYTIENNVWNGYENIQLKLKDIRLSEHLK
jgi:single-stranded-DNA-specific exonuclease